MSLIINELLCYLLAKIDSVPTDTLTRLVSENFSEDEVDAAKGLLCSHVNESIRAGTKRGQNKKKHNLDDIVKMLVTCDRECLPKFVALDLSKLPPISIDCIDVSALMRKQQLQDVEIANMKDMLQGVLKVTAETARKVEVGLSTARTAPTPSSCPTTSTVSDSLDASSASKPKSYAEVVEEHREDEWRVVNRRKRGTLPNSKLPAGPGAASNASAAGNGTAPTRIPAPRAAVIGSRKTDRIKAVAAVKRFSLFMSRLPPGTGEDAVKTYAKEQTGAEEVNVTQLKTKFDSYESYRIDIINPKGGDILDPELWASGLVVRRFFTKRQADRDQVSAVGLPATQSVLNTESDTGLTSSA